MKNIKAKKPTLAKKVSITKAKKPLANKKVAKKRIISKSLKTNKLATKKLSYKKTPIKRVSSQKRVKLSKPFGITVMLSGLAALVLLFVFGLPAILNPDSGEKPVLGVTANGVPVNPAFTDPNFYACVIDNLNSHKIEGRNDRTYTYYTTVREMAALKTLECSGYSKPDDLKISNTEGIELLTGLLDLNLRNNKISYINFRNMPNLLGVVAWDNNITNVDLSLNTDLRHFIIENNQLSSIDVSKNTLLTTLILDRNQLNSIDVSKNTALEYLRLSYNQLTSIDVSKNTALTELTLDNNQLTNIDVNKNTKLIYLYLNGNTKLNSIDVSNNTSLTLLDVSKNQLTSIDVSKNTELARLYISYSQLTSIDVSKNTVLAYLYISNNQLTSLDVSKNIGLNRLYVDYNQLINLDISNNTKLTDFAINNNLLDSQDITKNSALTYLDVTYNPDLKYVAAITSSESAISHSVNGSKITTNNTSVTALLNDIKPISTIISTGVYRNGVKLVGGDMLKGDTLRISIEGNTSQYFEYQIVLPAVPTVLSYGNLTSSIDTNKGIIYRRYFSFVNSVDTDQITVKEGDVTIKSAYMAYSDGSLIKSKHAFLKNGNKLIIKLSDGTTTEFVVKTAWRW